MIVKAFIATKFRGKRLVGKFRIWCPRLVPTSFKYILRVVCDRLPGSSRHGSPDQSWVLAEGSGIVGRFPRLVLENKMCREERTFVGGLRSMLKTVYLEEILKDRNERTKKMHAAGTNKYEAVKQKFLAWFPKRHRKQFSQDNQLGKSREPSFS